jgi:molybdopterin molybdotransferase
MLIPLSEARKLIDNTDFRKAPIKRKSIYDAVGKVVGEDVYAMKNIPDTNLSAMDGFAFRVSDYNKYGELKIVGSLHPSSSEIPELKEGEAYYVTTGSPIPKGADAVARIEASKVMGERVKFIEEVFEGKDIKFIGEDISEGSLIISKGEILTPYHLGILTIQGIKEINVANVKSCVIASGDEIVPYYETGKIPDSISPILLYLLGKFGESKYFGVVKDNKEEIINAMKKLSEECSYIVLIGGSSMGDKDYSKKVIREMGTLLFEGVAVNVIKRGGVGVIGDIPVINLPGQVVSAVTVFHEHGLHILSRMIGKEVRKFSYYFLDQDISVKHKMDSVFLFRTEGVYAKPLRWGTGLYSELAKANAFGILARDKTYKRGETVELQQFLI